MRKNIFDEPAREEMKRRIHSLSESLEAKWGVMRVAEMLHHCSASLRVIMHAEAGKYHTTPKQHLLRFLFLHVVSKFPKDAATREKLDVKKTAMKVKDFEAEKADLLSLMELFSMQQNIFATHPYFGKLSHHEWGIFTWMHIDHHLRQFGK